MPLIVSLTKIPQLNSIVVKQEGGHLFIAAKDSIIIDKDGLIQLIYELMKINFLDIYDIEQMGDDWYLEEQGNAESS